MKIFVWRHSGLQPCYTFICLSSVSDYIVGNLKPNLIKE